jgi:KDO2-lipid IV(A) lauroyltransferase
VLALDCFFPLANPAIFTNADAVARRRSSTKSNTRYFVEYAAFRGFETLFRFVPATWIDALGRILGHIAYDLASGIRKTVIRNCRIAWGDTLDDAALETLAHDTFRNVGANLLGGVRCMLMSEQQIRKHVTIEGNDLLQAHLKVPGQSAILALAHMGNWEILARIASLIAPGVASGAFFRPLNNPYMNRMTMRRRQQSGTQLYSNKEGFSQSCTLLRAGGMLGILADQHAGNSGSLTPFFGRPTSCSPLVELLHRRTGAMVFYVSIKRTRPAHWQINITAHDPVINITTQSVMKGVEQALSTSPCDGFWFHNRWKLPIKRPFELRQSRQSQESGGITKPWRYAFVGSTDPAIAQVSTAAIEHLVRQQPDAEIFLINIPPTFAAENATFADSQISDLGKVLQQWDEAKSYPLDIVVYFCPVAATLGHHKIGSSPMAVGLCDDKNASLDIRITPPDTTMDDPLTWWHYVRALGCSLPESTS